LSWDGLFKLDSNLDQDETGVTLDSSLTVSDQIFTRKKLSQTPKCFQERFSKVGSLVSVDKLFLLDTYLSKVTD
jgi:hypothetical protein